MAYNEDDYLLLSGIQHFAFCRRQWALIHIEQQWQDNLRTVEGNILHEKAHGESLYEKRGDLLIVRGLAIASAALGLSGACDIVEFHSDPGGAALFGRKGRYRPVPVEYKRGEPKTDRSDMLQLCAQAMCLEEMLACAIPKGYLYYGETKHRLEVPTDSALRDEVLKTTREMHELYQRRYTPKVKPGSFCKACSLHEQCLPKLCQAHSVAKYITGHMEEEA
jgi:CRISPR-associated exonuclease Cas4